MFFIRFLLVLLCSCSSIVTSAEIMITVKSEASVLRSTYTLSDVAVIESTGKLEGLEDMRLGASAKIGQFVNVPLQNIKTRVYKFAPEIAKSIDWRGAKIVKVHSKGQKVNIDHAKKISATALSQWLSKHYQSYGYKLVKSARDITVPYGAVTFKTSIRASEKALKRMVVWFDVYVDNTFYQSYRFWYQTSARQEVFLAKSRIETKTPLDLSLFKMEYVDVTNFNGAPVNGYKSLEGHQTIKVIESGAALTYNMLEKIPFVTKGQLINVYVRLNNVGISTKAIALKNGNINEKIPMLNPATKGKYMATVVGEKQVVVQ